MKKSCSSRRARERRRPCRCVRCAGTVRRGGAQGPSTSLGTSQNAPRYKFDPDWPKPLPNKWKIGGVIGLGIDKDDNVWVYHRPTT